MSVQDDFHGACEETECCVPQFYFVTCKINLTDNVTNIGLLRKTGDNTFEHETETILILHI